MKIFKSAGYEVAHFEHVALASRNGLEAVTDLLGDGRAIGANTEVGRLLSVYVPNGQKAGTAAHKAKLKWFEKFNKAIGKEIDTYGDVIIAGDMNVARSDLDVWSPEQHKNRNLFTPAEREALAKLLGLGLTDVFREFYGNDPGLYTWWNYAHDSFDRNRGWRLDYILATKRIAQEVEHAIIDVIERGEHRTSDHAPLWVDIRA